MYVQAQTRRLLLDVSQKRQVRLVHEHGNLSDLVAQLGNSTTMVVVAVGQKDAVHVRVNGLP